MLSRLVEYAVKGVIGLFLFTALYGVWYVIFRDVFVAIF